MAEILTFASLALFVLLAVAFAWVLRRAARVVAVAREEDAFRRDGASLADRAGAAIAAGAEGIDRVRRRTDAPAALDDALPPLLETLAGLRVEADALAPPAALDPLRVRIADEVERAVRSVEMVVHGCVILGVDGGRAHQLEGETSVKRGYLNLLHAREERGRLGAGLRAGRTAGDDWYSDRPRSD